MIGSADVRKPLDAGLDGEKGDDSSLAAISQWPFRQMIQSLAQCAGNKLIERLNYMLSELRRCRRSVHAELLQQLTMPSHIQLHGRSPNWVEHRMSHLISPLITDTFLMSGMHKQGKRPFPCQA